MKIGRSSWRKNLIMVFALGVALCCAPAMAIAQAEKPRADASGNASGAQRPSEKLVSATDSLEKLLSQALKSNPDIRVAEAKLREAEAELHRARLQVTQRIAVTYQLREQQRAAVEWSTKKLERVYQLNKKSVISREDIDMAQRELAEAKAKLAAIEADLSYAVGLPLKIAGAAWPMVESFLVEELTDRFTLPREDYWARKTGLSIKVLPSGTVTRKIRKALDTPVVVNIQDKELYSVLDGFQKRYDIPFILAPVQLPKVHLKLDEPVPLGAALQALEDSSPKIRFVVRDYGVLVTTMELAPPQGISLYEFWKSPSQSAEVKSKDAKPTR